MNENDLVTKIARTVTNTLMLAENRDTGLYYIRDNEWTSGFVFDPPTGPFRAINGPGFGGRGSGSPYRDAIM